MAIVQQYPLKTPKNSDLLVGTSIPDPNTNDDPKTSSFSISSIGSFLTTENNIITGGGTLNTISLFTPDGQKIGDSIITQAAAGTGVTVTGRLNVTSDFSVAGVAELYDSLTVDGTLTVDDVATFNDALTVHGGLVASDPVTINSTLTVSHSTFMNGALTVEGTSAFNDEAVFWNQTVFEEDANFQWSVSDESGYTGTAGQVLSSTGYSVRWIDAPGGGGGGTVTNITTTAPITGGTITQTGTIGITLATASADGYLSSTDWNTFNNKQSTSEKGQADGYAPLNENNKVPTIHLPDSLVGAVVYQGTWDATNNIPELPVPAAGNNGHYYIVSDAGTYSGITYAVGDWIISNGIAWEKVDNTQDVNSVFGRQGNIVAVSSDYAEFYDANVQSDWSVTDNTSDAFILNKPVIPSATSDLTNDSGYIQGTTTSQTAITEIKTLTSAEYQSETKLNNIMYVII
jgi:hypothetical protein